MECEAAGQMAWRRTFFCDAFCKLQLILRRCGSGVAGMERMPCAYFEGKNRAMKAKKERGGIIIPKDKFKEFVEF